MENWWINYYQFFGVLLSYHNQRSFLNIGEDRSEKLRFQNTELRCLKLGGQFKKTSKGTKKFFETHLFIFLEQLVVFLLKLFLQRCNLFAKLGYCNDMV